MHLNASAMAASSGSLVVAERHTRLVALDPNSGDKRWDRRVEGCWGNLVLAGNRCLYLDQSGVLHCFDLGIGQPSWTRSGLRLRRHLSVVGDVVFVGGWRDYHPLSRLSLTDGTPLPFDGSALAGAGPFAEPLPLPDANTVLIAGAGRPALIMMTASGAVRAEWPLPEPILFPDGGGFGPTFLSGRRTVMTFDPDDGPRVLWRHDRDLRLPGPLLDGDTLWLVDDAGLAVVDVARGTVAQIDHRGHGNVSAAALALKTALFAFADGSLIAVDRSGAATTLTRVHGRIHRLVVRDGLVHTLAKGHLRTFTRQG